MYVIVVGSFADGFSLRGDDEGNPFPDSLEAAEQHCKHEIWEIVIIDNLTSSVP